MAIRRCNYCGKPFNSAGTDICAECMSKIDDAYVKVRKYIYQNPDNAQFSSIVENAEISEKALNYLIDSGKIEINKSRSGAKCQICGAETSGGMLCESCRVRILSVKPPLKEHSAVATDNKREKSEWNPLSFRKNSGK